jgi:hypothetical protein
MSIQFFPLGSPVSSSFAISASFSLISLNVPATASQAEFALLPVGPEGPPFVTVNATVNTII